MFELLFKYPRTVFSKGTLVLAGGWPAWLLAAGMIAVAAGFGWAIWRQRYRAVETRGARSAAVWGLQTALVALLLLMLWQPALSVVTLKPRQNIVAVVVDDSRSMAMAENGVTRREQALKTLNGGLLKALGARFQVRLYRLGANVERIGNLDQLKAASPATHIGEGLQQVVAEAASLPIGAVVLASDGADNSGGVDSETINEIRRRHIPIHTIGFGRLRMAHDLEVTDAQIPARALADSRLAAQVTFHQRGYANQKAHLTVRESGKVLASKIVTLKPDGVEQNETVLFNAGVAGAKNIEVSFDPLTGEENAKNNQVTRVVNVDAGARRILYMEGEPRWEFKFIRRAVEDDRSIALTTILRTTQNKIYVQGIQNPKDFADGFPSKVEDLFQFQGLIIGSVEANYFTATQQELIKQFVDRRGGGVLFLGGRFSLADGGYDKPPFSDLLPVTLPNHKDTFHRDPATAELTPAGRDSLICRLEEDPDANAARWKKLPYLMNYQEPGTPKPGAVVLAEMMPTSKGKYPLLITENYGRGRTAVLATEGTWRWQMLQPVADQTHEMFWRQLLRYLVTDTPTRVVASVPKTVLADEGHVKLRAEVRDTTYLPAADAQVEAHILGPEGITGQVALQPDALEPGVYTADWTAEKPGSYLTEVVARRGTEETGRDVITFRREDGVAENFHLEQNRELLEKLAQQTGGRYYTAVDAGKLGEDISYSEAGITVHEMKDLWNMPVLFLLLLALAAAEWLLRR
ncbi:MAG: glutamine amidotransferase, partial [Bryobacteraceae bacterium]